MYELRQYQKDILNKLWLSLKQHNKVLVSAPTGSGKTVMASALIDELVKRGHKVAFIVDRVELVKQSRDTFGAEKVSIIKAEMEKDYNPDKPIQLIMIQTFYARKENLPDFEIDYVLIDEVHQNWNGGRIREFLRIYDNAKVIGLSATPIDERGFLLEGFEDYIDLIQIPDLIKLGYLAKPICYMPESCVYDLSDVKVNKFDYDIQELDDLLCDLDKVGNIVKEWEKLAKNKKTIIFANSIRHAEMLNDEFLQKGYEPLLIHSKLSEHELKNARKELRSADIIINCAILTAGFDKPDIECVVMATCTKVLRKAIQCLGRGLRVTPTKKECIFIDCGNIFNTHGLPQDYRYYKFKPKNFTKSEYKECPECGNIELESAKVCSVCGYEFAEENEENESDCKKVTGRKQIERMIKIKSMQDELMLELRKLVLERGYKRGYAFYMFRDLLKNAKAQRTGLVFYKKIMKRIDRCREKGYKVQWLKYQ